MRNAAKSKPAKKLIAKFRLEVSRVILGNLLHMPCSTSDIEHMANIAELCDQYSLLIVLNWLATRYGFPLCRTSILKDIDCSRFPLLSWASLADRYPLQLQHDCREFISLFSDLCKQLEGTFEAELELAGDIYQQIIASPLRLNDKGQFYIDLQSDSRSKGEFYTPAWVADIAINDWLSHSRSDIVGTWRLAEPEDLPLICDPACGSGNFLHAALRKYIEELSDSRRVITLAASTLFGADPDGRAIQLAKLLILIACGPALGDIAEDKRASVIEEVLFGLDRNIRQADSLLAFCAETKDSSALEAGARNYDLLISNPPYISFGSRDQAQLSAEWQKYLKSRFPASSEYKLRYTSLFQEIGIELSDRADGHCIFLVPDAFLTGSYYQKLRNLILEKVDIIALTELPTDTIAGATVGRWCLAHYKQKNGSRANIILKTMLASEEPQQEFEMPIASFVSKDRQRFQLLFSHADLQIVQQCSPLNWLGSELSGHTGIRSRIGQAAIIANRKQSEQFHQGLISGAQLKAFAIDWRGDWLEISHEKLFAGGFDRTVIAGPKILLRQTGDSLIAAVDETGLYHLNNVHSFLPKQASERKQKAYYFCCLLNSDFYRYFYRLKTREHKRALAQIDIETVEHLPLPEANQQIVSRLSEIGRALSVKTDQLALEEMNRLIFDLFKLDKDSRAHVQSSLYGADSSARPGIACELGSVAKSLRMQRLLPLF